MSSLKQPPAASSNLVMLLRSEILFLSLVFGFLIVNGQGRDMTINKKNCVAIVALINDKITLNIFNTVNPNYNFLQYRFPFDYQSQAAFGPVIVPAYG
jgi:hypothetical protein